MKELYSIFPVLIQNIHVYCFRTYGLCVQLTDDRYFKLNQHILLWSPTDTDQTVRTFILPSNYQIKDIEQDFILSQTFSNRLMVSLSHDLFYCRSNIPFGYSRLASDPVDLATWDQSVLRTYLDKDTLIVFLLQWCWPLTLLENIESNKIRHSLFKII